MTLDPSSEMLYLISGSFSAIFLYVLSFNTRTNELAVVSRYDAHGPHQWLTTNARNDALYATSWAWPPALYSWSIVYGDDGVPKLEEINQAPISAISSYITVTENHTYSIGGPSGEVHAIRPDGGYGERVQEVLYVPSDEFENADKTRKALREGSHGIEFTKDGLAFVPHLGTDSIWIYQLTASGTLDFVHEVKSVREHDGPRHVLPHPSGQYLYVVTEHTSFLDVYETTTSAHPPSLIHVQAASLIPPESNPDDFRGDTLRLSRLSATSPSFLYATTRGKTPSTRGWLSVLELTPEGLIRSSHEIITGIVDTPASQQPLADSAGMGERVEPLAMYETPTSGGKANAIAVAPPSSSTKSGELLVLTDDEQGFVFVLQWDENKGVVAEIARTKLGVHEGEDVMASHAIWLG